MWRIGDEIYDTHASEKGQEWCRILMKEVKMHDPGGNAAVTIASNYMPWENAQKCADMVKMAERRTRHLFCVYKESACQRILLP